MTTKVLLVILVVAITACVSFDKSKMTGFEPYTENGQRMFRFKSERNDSVYPNDSYGESVRMTWLSEYLKDNDYCRDGYTIVSKDVVKGGDIYGLRRSYYYVGKCR